MKVTDGFAMKNVRIAVCLLLVLPVFACADASVAPDTEPHNVLFVGNSFTYYNNSLHNHYRALLKSARPAVASEGRGRILTISGGRLPEHRAGLNSLLASQQWDVVVLQGHSRGPIDDATADAFREAARDYVGMIRDAGAEPVFFMTWAYTGETEMTAKLDAEYTGIGLETGARVVPVGLAFARVTDERPDIALRMADARHPTLAGTYLAACAFYAVLHRASPKGIEYDAGLGKDVAAYLQRVAWDTVQAYRQD